MHFWMVTSFYLIKKANEQLINLYILNNDPENAIKIYKFLFGNDTIDVDGLIYDSQISKLFEEKIILILSKS